MKLQTWPNKSLQPTATPLHPSSVAGNSDTRRALERHGRRLWRSFVVRPMKTAVCSMFIGMIFATMLLSAGCEKKTGATNPSSESTPGSTKPLEAADLVGYDGKRLRKSVDHIRDANEKHNQEIEKMAGSGPDQ